jgi:predicted nucleotidyltransferase component of viral defense system
LIPEAYITAWRQQAPWPDDTQIEQDLILSRLMVEIANHELLGPELALRGGTCLHKLHFPEAARYSEDLDYVRSTNSGIKPYLAALGEVATEVGLEEHSTERSGAMVHAKFDAEPTLGAGRIRVKIEINIAETEPLRERVGVPFAVASPWWSGEAKILTFDLEELLGTKLRALYQRSKGRDLFDLWYAVTLEDLDVAAVVAAYRHYIGGQEFSYPELAANLEAKIEDRDFRDDLLQLVVAPPSGYDVDDAADIVISSLGPQLKNAPDKQEVEQGKWRQLRRRRERSSR